MGDRLLARLQKVDDQSHAYEARLIRRIKSTSALIFGVFRKSSDGGYIQSVDKGADKRWRVAPHDVCGAQDGDLVEAEQTGSRARLGLSQARVTKCLDGARGTQPFSRIAIYQNAIPDTFSEAALSEAKHARAPDSTSRIDLTHLPFITIDPADARDHDDACCALPDEDPANPGGFRLWVAIADVAHYVRAGSALDREARTRGNSTYFPDQVVPMLPEVLSGDLCSLHEGVERPCIAVEIVLSASGEKRSHRFLRASMLSRASLSYEEAQDAVEGRTNERTHPLREAVLQPLFAAYEALARARADRQPLELDLPERSILLSAQGQVASVAFRERFAAHKAIEEFMILANVCAAETLIARRTPLLFRVHEEPDQSKLDSLRETAKAAGFALAKGQVLQPRHINALLNAAAGSDTAELLNLATLRAMQQAYYGTENYGHFGLALKQYAHFTSPIRRYADLLVHRALISAHGWGEDGLSKGDIAELAKTAQIVSEAERRSMTAERDTIDRYLASYLADRVGGEFSGRVAGIARFGVFVKLDETGADGLVPIRELGGEYFTYDREANTLTGRESGRRITVGMRACVRLREAVPLTGGLLFELVELAGGVVPKARAGRRSTMAANKIRKRGGKADGKRRKSVARRR